MTQNISTVTSDVLHNKNCQAYLNQLIMSPAIKKLLPKKVRDGLDKVSRYDALVPYADIYTALFDYIDNKAQLNVLKTCAGFPDFINSIYINDNKILETTFEAIRDIPRNHKPVSKSIAEDIKKAVKDSSHKINTGQTPAEAGSKYGRFLAMIDSNFKPQHTTSLATVRSYCYNENNTLKELRFGTQGQRDNGKARVSPLFEAWLEQKRELTLGQNHIYFNNLAWDRTDPEGIREKELTNELHKLENKHTNIFVITLPADKGLMNHRHFKKTTDKLNYKTVYDNFLKIASTQINDSKGSNDFYISAKTRVKVYKNNETEILENLLNKSFSAMGIQDGTPLSSAQRQAVWFHFIKFELTNEIINKINPDTVNFSCKDAIDRGGVSSAYYHLIKSFETKMPLNRDEFEQALHAASTMVKGRGMNDHVDIIWNAVDAYVNADYQNIKNTEDKAWLIDWRDMNCPHARVDGLLTLRLKQTIAENADNKIGLKILELIVQTHLKGVSGKRLLLEAVTLTSKLPQQTAVDRYDALADKILIKLPMLHVLAGLMKSMVGLLLQSKKYIDSGQATLAAGWNATTGRNKIQHEMKEALKDLKKELVAADVTPKIEKI